MTDSAGRPWLGRSFDAGATRWAGDDGAVPPAYREALEAFRDGRGTVEAVVDALRGARLLVPLLATGEAGSAAHGVGDRSAHGVGDRSAELALVTVAGPDGRRVLPAFSSTVAMAAWNPAARPVPAPARQVALGAAADGTELVVVDPGTPQPFVLRRGALEALARDRPWTAPWRDAEVVAALRRAAAAEPAVAAVRVGPGDPSGTFAAPEVAVTVVLHGDAGSGSAALLERLQGRWREDRAVAATVDSLAVRLEGAWC